MSSAGPVTRRAAVRTRRRQPVGARLGEVPARLRPRRQRPALLAIEGPCSSRICGGHVLLLRGCRRVRTGPSQSRRPGHPAAMAGGRLRPPRRRRTRPRRRAAACGGRSGHEGAHGDQQPRDQEPVDVHDPQQLRAAWRQLPADLRHGQVEHGQVHGIQQARQGDDRQAGPLSPTGSVKASKTISGAASYTRSSRRS